MFKGRVKKKLHQIHNWMIKEPKEKAIFTGCNIIIFGIDSILLKDIIMPNVLGSITGIFCVVGIIEIMMSIFLWVSTGLLKILSGKEIDISLKYKFFINLLFIPLLFFLNKFITWIKYNYVKQINRSN